MKSALVIRGGALGDFILTLPSLHAFRNQYPEVRLEVMGYPHIADLAKSRFYAEAVRSIEHRSVAGFFADEGDLDRELSHYFKSFDIIVSYLYDPDHIFLSNLKRAGAKQVVSVDGKPSGIKHASEHLAAWLSELGVMSSIEHPKLYISKTDQEESEHIFSPSLNPFVAFHLGSGSPSKNWPSRKFIELADWFKARGLNVLAIDGPADSDAYSQFWKDPLSAGCIPCHNIPLTTLAATLQRCLAFVGHDSGISHLCAAVGAPTVAIFGPTDPKIWGPRGERVTILRRGSRTSDVSLEDVKKALKVA